MVLTSKNVGLGKFWQDLEIVRAFLIRSLVSAWFVFTFFRISASLRCYHSPPLISFDSCLYEVCFENVG